MLKTLNTHLVTVPPVRHCGPQAFHTHYLQHVFV